MTGDLPHGWTWAKLGDLGVEIRGQLTPEPGTTYDLYSVPTFPTGRPERIDGAQVKSGKRGVQPDDVLLCKINPRINRVWVVGQTAGHAQIASTEYLVLRPHEPRMSSFIQQYLSSPRFRDWIKLSVEGATGSHTRAKSGPILQQTIPIAPLAEQQRIVAAIEEHFSRLAAAESVLRRVLHLIDALRSSLLAAAFHTNGDLPTGWRLAAIGDIAEVQLGRQRSPQHHMGPAMRPYLRSANVTWDGISLDDVKEMNFDDADFRTFKLEPGDLLLNEASGTPNEVGKPAIWNGEIEGCCFQNTLLRLRPRELDLKYLYWYCYSAARSGRFGEAGRGVNIRHLGKRGLAQFPIPVAPTEERGRIVERLEAQFEQTATFEQSAQVTLNRVALLRRSLLAQAFAGHLMPQNPDDEPASVLLRRIAASRAAKPKRQKVKE